jgi:hypothetical protein
MILLFLDRKILLLFTLILIAILKIFKGIKNLVIYVLKLRILVLLNQRDIDQLKKLSETKESTFIGLIFFNR